MRIPSTEVQNNFGKYIRIAAEMEDVIIIRKGKEIAKLVPCEERHNIAEEALNYLVNNNKKLTYEEFLDFVEKTDAFYEMIDGEIFMMTSPGFSHQSVMTELITIMSNWFKSKKCRPLAAPLDITLEKSKNNICVVIPDIVVICDTDKINEKGRYMGVPTLAVEIISPSTRSRDMVKKLDLYMQTGIKEYWIVDIDKKEIYVYLFEKQKGEYEISEFLSFKRDMVLKSKTFEGLEIKLEEVFLV